MTDQEMFDIFDKTYSWKTWERDGKCIIEYKPIGKDYSEWCTSSDLEKCFKKLFKKLYL